MLLDASQLAGKVAVLSQASAHAARYLASDPDVYVSSARWEAQIEVGPI